MKNKKIISMICLGAILANAGGVTRKTFSIDSNIKTKKNINLYSDIEKDSNKTVSNNTENKINELSNSKIWVSEKNGEVAEQIKFDCNNMTIDKLAITTNKLDIKLISSVNGKVLAQSNNNIDNLNGAKFSYGDIISIKEPQQLYLSLGGVSILNLNNTSKINQYNTYINYILTKNGLEKVGNKNLLIDNLDYSGGNNVNVSGKTIANTKVYLYYLGGATEVISNSQGKFNAQIPIDQAPINSELELFVNKNNNMIASVNDSNNAENSNNEKIEISNNTNVPVFNITINSKKEELQAAHYYRGNNYTGIFDGRDLKINLINSENGEIINSFTGTKIADADDLVDEINGTKYTNGDILQIQSDSKYIPISLFNGKKVIKNNIENQYYQITSNGLINVTKDFINSSGLDILGSDNTDKISIEGKITPNTNITLKVKGKEYNTLSNNNGEYTFNLTNINEINKNTKFNLSAQGYFNTVLYPKINNKINIQNSFINFYNTQAGVALSIGFNPITQKFDCYNYGYTNEKNVKISLFNQYGTSLYSNQFNVNTIGNVAAIFNRMNFKYGDIIGLSYDAGYSIPTISSGNDVMGNVNGQIEYFEITRDGLVKVKMGNYATTNKLIVSNQELKVNLSLVKGQSKLALKANKSLVIIDNKNNIIDKSSLSELSNSDLIGEIPLSSINDTEEYQLGVEVGNTIYKVLENCNIYGNENYSIETNSENIVTISKSKPATVNITSSQDIESYLNSLSYELKNQINLKNSNNMNNNMKSLITKLQFFKAAGVNNLQKIYNLSDGQQFINWLLNNNMAMSYFIQGIEPGHINFTQLDDLYEIYNTYTNSRWGFNLKLAVATAIAEPQYITNPIAPAWTAYTPNTAGEKGNWEWSKSSPGGNPVERYNIFQNLYSNGDLLPIFSTLNMKFLKTTIKSDLPNSQIELMRGVMLEDHNQLINENGLINTVNTMNYNTYNPYTGISVQTGGFYGNHPSIYTVWRDGGVCGALSKVSVGASTIFGVPATPVGQPGHCAFEYDDNSNWEIGNDIYGWAQSSGGDLSGWSNGWQTLYTVLYTAAVKKGNLTESNQYLWLAQNIENYQQKLSAINQAIKINPLNLEAFKAKLSLYQTNKNITGEQYLDLANQVMNNFQQYPQPMFDLILKIKSMIDKNGTELERNEFAKNIIGILEKTAEGSNTYKQATISQLYLKNIRSYGIEDEHELQGEIYLNDWGQENTVNINLVNGHLIATGKHTWIGTNNNDYLEINLYNSNGKLLKSARSDGEAFGAYQEYNDFVDQINNTPYSIGDYITVSYETGKGNDSYLGFKNAQGENFKINNKDIFKITNNGLKKLNQNYLIINNKGYILLNGRLITTDGIINLASWGDKNTVSINFSNGEIIATGAYKWLASSNNGYLELNLYSSDGKLIKQAKASGEEFGSDQKDYDFSSLINGTKYSEGDIVTVKYKNNGPADGKLSFINNHGLENNIECNDAVYLISKNGLTPLKGYYIYNNSKVFNTINGILKEINVTAPTLSVKNISLKEGSKYNNNLLEAKTESGSTITYSGNVNTSKLGVYNVVVLAKDKYGLTTSKTVKVTITNSKPKTAVISIVKDIYYDNDNLVINGDVNKELKCDVSKKLLIENNNKVVNEISTVPVNWYSENKNNYSGYQVIINSNIINQLKANKNYKLYIEIEGERIPINITTTFNGYNLNLSNIGNTVDLKINNTKAISNIKDIYYDNTSLVINGNSNENLIGNISKELLIENDNKLIDKISVVPVNWYSVDKNDYSGYQVIINPDIINKLKINKNYKLYIEINKKKIPIGISENFEGTNINILNVGNIANLVKK